MMQSSRQHPALVSSLFVVSVISHAVLWSAVPLMAARSLEIPFLEAHLRLAVLASGLGSLFSFMPASRSMGVWIYVARVFVLAVVLVVVPWPIVIGAFCALLALDIARSLPFRVGSFTSAISLVVIVGSRYGLSVFGDIPVGFFSIDALLAGLLVVFVWVLGTALAFLLEVSAAQTRTIAQLDETVRRLTGTNTVFQELANTAENRSRREERNRITRELHDALGYLHTNIMMMAEAGLRDVADADVEMKERLRTLRDQARTALKETRAALRDLRKTQDERVNGLQGAVRLARMFEKATGVSVTVSTGNIAWTDSNNWSSEINTVVYRIIQEGMINAFRHGRATKIELRFRRMGQDLLLQIHDNGKGNVSINEGIGLKGMHERVSRIGGEISLNNSTTGFTLLVQLPLEKR